MSNLHTTIEEGKKVTHIHDGNGHYVCGMADDLFLLNHPTESKPSCFNCIDGIKEILKIAKKYKIKL